jgi:hypothetical protein
MTPEDNGILALVGGAAIGAGSQSFPRPGPDQPPEREAVVDAGHRGVVRIRYKLMRHAYRKNVTWFWTACHAEPVESDTLNEPPVV